MSVRITAENVAGSPELFNLAWRIGRRGRFEWDCTGYSESGETVRFARLVPDHDGIRQITIYVDPDQEVFTDGDTSAWLSRGDE